MATSVVTIRGTHCESCQALIEDVCREIAGVRSCAVDYRTGKTVVEHDGTLDWAVLKREIEDLGQYQVDLPTA